jgi:transposase InsO family protein
VRSGRSHEHDSPPDKGTSHGREEQRARHRARTGRRDELLNREIFYTLKEARVLIEAWREEYNQRRPHSALGYRPPAPEAIQVAVGLT